MMVQLAASSADNAPLHDATRSGHGRCLSVRLEGRRRETRVVDDLDMHVLDIFIDIVVVHAIFHALGDKKRAGAGNKGKKDKRVETHLEEVIS